MWKLRFSVQAKLARFALQSESTPLSALLGRVLHNLSMEPTIGRYDPQVLGWRANAGPGSWIRYDIYPVEKIVDIKEIQTTLPEHLMDAAWAAPARLAG